jgi:hypothetical protein
VRQIFNKSNPNVWMILGGFFYSSWPLGFWLNPFVAHRLASELGASNQPFNWVFIAMDIASGFFTVTGCWKLIQIMQKGFGSKSPRLISIAIYSTAIFGVLTALDAILPLNCLEGESNCLPSLHNPYFIIHGIISIGSIAGLTTSIVAIWLVVYSINRTTKSVEHLLPAIFLVIWVGFGVFTLHLILQNQSSGLAQHFFISFCSLWIIAMPTFTKYIQRYGADSRG